MKKIVVVCLSLWINHQELLGMRPEKESALEEEKNLPKKPSILQEENDAPPESLQKLEISSDAVLHDPQIAGRVPEDQANKANHLIDHLQPHECPFFLATKPEDAFFSQVPCEVIANAGKNWDSFKKEVTKLGKYALDPANYYKKVLDWAEEIEKMEKFFLGNILVKEEKPLFLTRHFRSEGLKLFLNSILNLWEGIDFCAVDSLNEVKNTRKALLTVAFKAISETHYEEKRCKAIRESFLPNRLSHQNCSNCVPILLYSNNKSAILNQIERNFTLLKETLDQEVKIRKAQEEVRAKKNQLKNRCAVYSFVFLVISFFLKLIVNI